MIKLLILGNGQPVKLIINSLNKEYFKVVNVEQDRVKEGQEQSDFEIFLKSYGIFLNKLKELSTSDYNLVLSINYNKIIDLNLFAGVKLINLHMGLLPKYRGNNANAWAVINGENKVGYTIHEVSDVLDGGDIYYKYEYDISMDYNYLNGKNSIDQDIANNISRVMFDIFNEKLIPVCQKDATFTYCVKLRPSDGVISDWNVSSDFLIRKSYVFGRPLGTGLRFQYRNEFYDIDKVGLIHYYEPSIGISGSIVNIRNNRLWIKTSDTAIELSGIKQSDSIIEVNKIFKIGMRL